MPLLRWLDQRLGLEALRAVGRHKEIPVHRHSLWYYGGGLALLLLGVQVVTGLLLLMYYHPGSAEAHASVTNIIEEVPHGQWIRSLHARAADALILCLVVHGATAFFMRAYQRPREVTWWTGLAMMGLVLTLAFSGYVLPLDERGFFATQIGLQLLAGVPALGEWITNVVLGGSELTDVTVRRFFALHVAVLPWTLVLLVGAHLWLIQHHGLRTDAHELPGSSAMLRSRPFWPEYMRGELFLWLTALSVLFVVAAAVPQHVGPPADPLSPTPLGIHPEWYFLGGFQAIRLAGKWLPGAASEAAVGVGFAAMLLFALAAPFLDPPGSSRFRTFLVRCAGGFLLVLMLVLTVWGYVSARTQAG